MFNFGYYRIEMTLQEKLNLGKPTDEQQSAVIHLYKEGRFYVAYQYSACLLKRHIKSDIQIMRKTRKDGFSYLRVGLPVESNALAPYLRLDETGAPVLGFDIFVEQGLGLTFVLEDCVVDLEIGKKGVSPVTLNYNEAEREVLEELRGLNLAELSPMMAFSRICWC